MVEPSMNVSVEPPGRVKVYIEELRYSVPDWFLSGVNNWMRYGNEVGRFFGSLLCMDFRGIMRYADPVSRETFFGMYKFLYNHIPGNVWGSEKNCKVWQEMEDGERLKIYKRWREDEVTLLDADHPLIPVGTPDDELYYADKLHQDMKQMIGALLKKLPPDQVAEVLLESRNQFTVDAVNAYLKTIGTEVETDGN